MSKPFLKLIIVMLTSTPIEREITPRIIAGTNISTVPKASIISSIFIPSYLICLTNQHKNEIENTIAARTIEILNIVILPDFRNQRFNDFNILVTKIRSPVHFTHCPFNILSKWNNWHFHKFTELI